MQLTLQASPHQTLDEADYYWEESSQLLALELRKLLLLAQALHHQADHPAHDQGHSYALLLSSTTYSY